MLHAPLHLYHHIHDGPLYTCTCNNGGIILLMEHETCPCSINNNRSAIYGGPLMEHVTCSNDIICYE